MEDRIQQLTEENYHDYLMAKTMAKVAMYNITGNTEEPTEFEKRLADREFENLLKHFLES